MSTRATINFGYQDDGKKEVVAKIYHHSDGYPDGEHGILAKLQRFFTAVEEQTTDTRFSDPAYLAAKFVVYVAHGNAQTRFRAYNGATKEGEPCPLAFLGVGVLQENPGDIEYEYFVDCSGSRRPEVFWREADAEEYTDKPPVQDED